MSFDGMELMAADMSFQLIQLGCSALAGFGLGGICMLLVFLSSKKKEPGKSSQALPMLILFGVCGFVVGFFSSYAAFKKTGERLALHPPHPADSDDQTDGQTALLPNGNPPMSEERKRLLEEQSDQNKQRMRDLQAQQMLLAKQREEERKARMAQTKLMGETAKRMLEEKEKADAAALQAMTLEELEKVEAKRQERVTETRIQLHDVQQTPEERRVAAKQFSEAVRAHTAASKALQFKRHKKATQ